MIEGAQEAENGPLFDFAEVVSMAYSMDEEDLRDLPDIIKGAPEDELMEIVTALDEVINNVFHIFTTIRKVRPSFRFPNASID